MKIEIKHRFSQEVLFTAEIADSTEKKCRIRVALEAAVEARANLSGANLSGANLYGAYLSGAYLSGANLSEANLSEANLSRADISEANLSRAYLSEANLSGANLSVADLSEANLSRAYLYGANLSGANLSVADLSEANLSRAYLYGANLYGANLSGAIYGGPPPATKKESIANLDKVREIILDDQARLYMNHWHDSDGWKKRTCAEEAVCGTTHCLAGWLQICSTDEKIRALAPNLAGALCAPVAAKMFFKENDEVLAWLRDRKYVEEAEIAHAKGVT